MTHNHDKCRRRITALLWYVWTDRLIGGTTVVCDKTSGGHNATLQ
jgi:hypothetical protein